MLGNCSIKELRHSIQLQNNQVRVYSDRILSKKIGTDDSLTHEPTPNIPFRGIPLVFNYGLRLY